MTVKNEKFVIGILASALLHSLVFVSFVLSKSSTRMPTQIFSVDIHEGTSSQSSPLAPPHRQNSTVPPQHVHKSAQTVAKDATQTSTVHDTCDSDEQDRKNTQSSYENAEGGGGGHSTNSLSIYSSQIIQILNQKKIYPKVSIDREEEGTVVVSVKLAASGLVENVEVVKPAIFDRLNAAALQTIHAIPRFPPPPLSTGSIDFTMQIPLTYKIERH